MCLKRNVLILFLSLASLINSFAQQVAMRESAKGIDFLLDGSPILTYQMVKEPVPAGIK
mgnify:FL=1